jgi:hypothetical protein
MRHNAVLGCTQEDTIAQQIPRKKCGFDDGQNAHATNRDKPSFKRSKVFKGKPNCRSKMSL